MNILESQIFVKVRLAAINLNKSPLISLFIDNYDSVEIISNYLNEMINNQVICMLNIFEEIELSELSLFTDYSKQELMGDFINLYQETKILIDNVSIKNYVYCNLNIEKPDTLILEYRECKNHEHKSANKPTPTNISDTVYIRSIHRR